MASEVLVPKTPRDVDTSSHAVTMEAQPIDPEQRQITSPSARSVSFGGLEIERKRQSAKVYEKSWEKFVYWCSTRVTDSIRAPVREILAFPQSLMNSGFAYRTIGVYRSTKTLLPTWNLHYVLKFLQGPPFEPLIKASLHALTWKTSFLVAITSARRSSEIAAMGRREPYFRVDSEGVRIRMVLGFLPKTATPSHLGQDIMFPSFKTVNKLVCVKLCVKLYLKATDPFVATTENHLFVCYGGKKKGKPVSKKTIASCIVKTIKVAYAAEGLDAPGISAHSTRGTATSSAVFNGATFESVMRAADWRTRSTFAKHYTLDLWKQKNQGFGRAVQKDHQNDTQ